MSEIEDSIDQVKTKVSDSLETSSLAGTILRSFGAVVVVLAPNNYVSVIEGQLTGNGKLVCSRSSISSKSVTQSS